MGKNFDGRLEVVAQRAKAANTARAVGEEVSEEDMARAFCILADLYPDSVETKRVMAMLGPDVWEEMLTTARAVVQERGLTL